MRRWNWMIGSLSCFLIGTILFAWPALLNRGPILFPDTSAYLRGADAAVVATTGHVSRWSNRLVVDSAPQQAASGEGSTASTMLRPTRPVLAGRSIYFGGYLYFALELLGELGAVLLTSALSVLVLLVATSPLRSSEPRSALVATLCLLLTVAVLTPFPFFVSRLMPDVLTGLLIISFASLLLWWGRHGTAARILLAATCLFAAISHTSHALLIVPLTVAVFIVSKPNAGYRGRAIVLGAAVLVLGALLQILFSQAVRMNIGQAPISPPFISARLIADGPGLRELEDGCPASGWALCDLMAAMPQPSDNLLWSQNRRTGIFMAADSKTQRRLSEQDVPFAATVALHRPFELVSSTLTSIARQLTLFELEAINYGAEEIDAYRLNLPRDLARRVVESPAARGEIPVRFTVSTTIAITSVSLLIIFLALGAVALGRVRFGSSARFATVLLVAVAANSAITGALSTPHGRYQMRAIWVLPVAALGLMRVRRSLVLSADCSDARDRS